MEKETRVHGSAADEFHDFSELLQYLPEPISCDFDDSEDEECTRDEPADTMMSEDIDEQPLMGEVLTFH